MNRKQRRTAAKLGGTPRGSRMGTATAVISGTSELLAAGLRHHQAGRLDEAERLYRQILSIDARHADSLHLLGVIAHSRGRLDLAVEMINKALAIKPGYPPALCNLGVALKAQGRLDEAITCYEQAVANKPDYAEALSNLGNALKARGRLNEAITRYEQALAIKPASVEVLCILGNTLNAQGRLNEAIARCEQALAIKPDCAEALFNFGVALLEQGRVDQAIACFEKTLAIKPDAKALSNLGAAHMEQRRPEEALACYQRALTLEPDLANAHNGLGLFSHLELGRLDEARQHFETAIRLEPRNTTYYLNLGNIKRFSVGDPHLAAMEELAKDPGSLTPKNQIELNFALGKAYDDLGEHEQSLRYLIKGNALKRRHINYDEVATLDLFDRIQRLFTRELIEHKRGLGDPSHVPVFIIGMPRSGSTLVEQILASHSQVFGTGELSDFADIVTKVPILPGQPKEFPEPVSGWSGSELRQLGATYVDRIQSRAPWAELIADKMLGNFQFAGLINLALPNARIIHIQRNAVDTCLSSFSKLFVAGQEFTYEFGELGRYYMAYSKLMDHWRSVLPAGVMLEVRYEDVVADIEQQTRRILDFCGLEWDPSCLAFYKTDRPVLTASSAQVRQPIYGTSIGRWRPYQQFLEPLLKELGLDQFKDPPPT